MSGWDAGCVAGARDANLFHTWGMDVYGIDAVDENIRLAGELNPEIGDRVQVPGLMAQKEVDHLRAP